MTSEQDSAVPTDEQILREIGAILDHPSLYMGGPSFQSMKKAEQILPIFHRLTTEAHAAGVAEERARVCAWLRKGEVHHLGVEFSSADRAANAIERGEHVASGEGVG